MRDGPRRYHLNWPTGNGDRHVGRWLLEDDVEPEPIAADGIRLPAGNADIGPVLNREPPGSLTGRSATAKTL
jgi:hypothetical protein